MTHALRGAIGGAGDDHPTVAMTDKDHLIQILVPQQLGDFFDVKVQVDLGAQQMEEFPHSGQGGCVHAGPLSPQQLSDSLIAPAPVPAAVYQYVGRQCASPSRYGVALMPRCASLLRRSRAWV